MELPVRSPVLAVPATAAVLFVDGGPDDVAYDNARANYDQMDVPAVRASNASAGRIGLWHGMRNDGFDSTPSARDCSLGEKCGLRSTDGWDVTSKDFGAGVRR